MSGRGPGGRGRGKGRGRGRGSGSSAARPGPSQDGKKDKQQQRSHRAESQVTSRSSRTKLGRSAQFEDSSSSERERLADHSASVVQQTPRQSPDSAETKKPASKPAVSSESNLHVALTHDRERPREVATTVSLGLVSAIHDQPPSDVVNPSPSPIPKPSPPSNIATPPLKSVNAKPVVSPLSAVGKSNGPKNYHGKQQPPDRPGFGVAGRPIMVRANFFPVKLPRQLTIHHYDITIGPSKYPKRVCRKVYSELESNFRDGPIFHGHRGAFDGRKNVYFSQPLHFKGDSVQLQLELVIDVGDKPRVFTATLKKASIFNVDLNRIQEILADASESMPMVQALDVVLKHMPSLKTEPIGRSFFSRPGIPVPLGQGREAWSGYYQSLRPTMGWKLMLNVDTAATAFYTEQSVIDFMCVVLRRCSPRDATQNVSPRDLQQFTRGPLDDVNRKKFEREIKGLKIVVTHLAYPRKYSVNGVTRLSATKQTFPLDNGTNCTVERYFREHYPNSRLQYPHLPCLHVGQKNRHVYIPLELCKIVGGQRCVKKLTDIQTSNLIRHTAKPAIERERMINKAVRSADFNRDPVANDFGISVDTKMVEVPARVLDPPILKYSGDQCVQPQHKKGAWDMRDKEKFYHGVEIDSWVLTICSEYCQNMAKVNEFTDRLQQRSCEMGMTMRPPRRVEHLGQRESVQTLFERICDTVDGLQLIIAIIDKGNKSHYNEIKRIGDTEGGLGVATQCVLLNTVERKCNPATLSNICLKINARLGGINSIIDPSTRPLLLQREPVIIFGADVTHPRSDDTTSPSIAAVMASMDFNASKYRALHRNQKHRQEIIAELKEMARLLLIGFYRENEGTKPSRIIFFRDGVSEGQFQEVRYSEVSSIQQACLELQKDGTYQPPITFLVVQKRHHTRLFPTSQEDAIGGRNSNVPPGTTVEKGITHSKEFDFYLCSHAAIQGTSRPCHYHMLWDDSDFSADDIQKLAYQLCHMFWRCNRSVSYPAPAYYAHRDAAHARVLVQAEEDRKFKDGASIVSSSSDGGLSDVDRNDAIKIHPKRGGGMYFM